MDTRSLEDSISAVGVANAVIYLKPEYQTKRKDEHHETGRVDRFRPEIDHGIYEELENIFRSGWEDLAGKGEEEIDELGKSVSSIRNIIESERSGKKQAHIKYFPHLGMIYGAVNHNNLESLKGHSTAIHQAPKKLQLIEPVSTKEVDVTVDSDDSWGIGRMKAPEIWAKGCTGKNIVIAHLDTGADSSHPALKDVVSKFMVFDDEGNETPQTGSCIDSGEHGSHTAGTMTGRLASSLPIIGMAPDAELVCGTVIIGGDLSARIYAGIDWAIGTGARILNMSIGVFGWDDSFEPLIEKLIDKNIFSVAAIGNNGPDTSFSPGNYPNVFSVGAVDKTNIVDVNSSSKSPSTDSIASGPKVCAPGVDIKSSIPGGDYKLKTGTSMAAPHIAGLAALLLQAKPDASIQELETAILESCERPPGSDPARIGHGIPDGLKALDIISKI